MEIEQFREISLDQFVKVKMCNRFMVNWCIKRDIVQKNKVDTSNFMFTFYGFL